MNHPIRCELPPFPGMNGKAESEAPPCTSGAQSQFGEFLDARLDHTDRDRPPRVDSEKPREREASDAAEAIALSTPLVVQTPPPPVVITASGLSNSSPGVGMTPDVDPKSGETEPAAGTTLGELLTGSRRDTTAPGPLPSEQKLPTNPHASPPAMAQIAQKTTEPAKIARGMVAAQPPLMPTAAPTKEETTQKVGLEHFEAVSFEQPIPLDPFRESAQPRSFVPDVTALDAFHPEMPEMEGVTGDFDFQPVRSVDSANLVEAIRTHIELLRTSGVDQLEVVLRPDAGTELRLHVETVNGIVQVQARCERGDFAHLDAHWSTIQNSLANQGVRVEPLQQGSAMQFQQQSQDFRDFPGRDSKQPTREEFLIEQDLSAHPKSHSQTPGASRPGVVRGWQSWA